MRLHRRVKLQLTLFAVVALVAGAIMIFGYIKLPTMLFGTGPYTVTVQFEQAAGLYASSGHDQVPLALCASGALGPGPGFDAAAGRRQLAPPIAVLAALLRVPETVQCHD
jgi:hypothetical protein